MYAIQWLCKFTRFGIIESSFSSSIDRYSIKIHFHVWIYNCFLYSNACYVYREKINCYDFACRYLDSMRVIHGETVKRTVITQGYENQNVFKWFSLLAKITVLETKSISPNSKNYQNNLYLQCLVVLANTPPIGLTASIAVFKDINLTDCTSRVYQLSASNFKWGLRRKTPKHWVTVLLKVTYPVMNLPSQMMPPRPL